MSDEMEVDAASTGEYSSLAAGASNSSSGSASFAAGASGSAAPPAAMQDASDSPPPLAEDPSDCGQNQIRYGSASVLAPSATIPSVTVSLHPLVILHLSEHWTRIRAQDSQTQKVIGALIGKQNGRNIEVMNAFELKFDVIDGDIIINQDYYTTKEEQYKQVFSDLDFLGWYTTGGDAPTDQDIKVQKQICLINECPIMLQLNPQSRNNDKLPVFLYESLIDLVHGEPQMLFVPLTYILATEEAERIGVDHVVRMSSNEVSNKSVVAEHLTAQFNAIKMLHSRVELILAYIGDVEAGRLEHNHEILREAHALISRLPVVEGSAFYNEFFTQTNDVSLIAYLGILTKGCNLTNNMVNKFNVMNERQSNRRMRGLFF